MEVVRTKYYQPDPIVSHVIQAGVTMDCFGVKKTGGKFKEIPNKLSQDEFLALLTKHKPKKSNHGARPCSSFMRKLKIRRWYHKVTKE